MEALGPTANQKLVIDDVKVTAAKSPKADGTFDEDYTLPGLSVGTSSDPMILGLDGRVFKFMGNSGSWYSVISAPSFQWNMKVQKFEECPDFSDTFTIDFGLSLFDLNRRLHNIEVSVVNEFNTDVGCSGRWGLGMGKSYSCLAAGSLELAIDR